RTGSATRGSCAGSNEPSPSRKHTMSAVAASSPACAAAPKPRCGTDTTIAPWAAATCAEPSVEPLSATIARYPAGIRDSTHGSAAASSRHGTITSVMVSDLTEVDSQARGLTASDAITNHERLAAGRAGGPRVNGAAGRTDRIVGASMRILVTGGAGF